MSIVKVSDGSNWAAGLTRYTSGSGWSESINTPTYVTDSSSGQYRAVGQAISATFGTATASSGDIGLICVASQDGARAATPAGWTQQATIDASSASKYYQVFTKVMTAAEAGPTVNQDGGYTTGQEWAYASMLIRGANTSTILNSSVETYNGLTQSVPIGGLTSTSAPNTLIVAILTQTSNTNRTIAQYLPTDPQNTTKLKQLDLQMQSVHTQATAISHNIFIQPWSYGGPVNWRHFYWSSLSETGAFLLTINPS